MRCLLFVTEFSYLAPIISTQGEIVGKILMELTSSLLPAEPLEIGPEGQKGSSFNQSDLPDFLERNADSSG
ncbi:unnamed protein product [Dibothriocephalus latus]|uniref:Uncharacterized protein n=1 Tax=Dibothriocephalus latus TaxID=60516 RepID=A0A3P7NS94_DIBLA|nr:unnamed protein product [Dibothriocephalus latus]